MKPQGARYDLIIDKGSTFNFPFTWKDKNGTAINNTGYAFTFQARDVESKTLVINLTSPTNITVGGTNGKVTITIPSSTTTDYTFTVAKYNIEYTAPTGERGRLLYGFVTTDEDVAP